MTDPLDLLTSSDLDAYKNSSQIISTAITVSGSVTAGSIATFSGSIETVTDPDYSVILFDNSALHSGKFKNLGIEAASSVFDTVSASYLSVIIAYKVTASTVQFTLYVPNPFVADASLTSTTLNFKYIPYEATVA